MEEQYVYNSHKQAKFKLSLIALSIFSFSQFALAQESNEPTISLGTNATKSVIHEDAWFVTAINASGSIFATRNKDLPDSTWQLGKSQIEEDKFDHLPFTTNKHERVWINALNDAGNVAAGFTNRMFTEEEKEVARKERPLLNIDNLTSHVPTIWKWDGEKWGNPIILPHNNLVSYQTSMIKGEVYALNGIGNIAVGNSRKDDFPLLLHATVWTEKEGSWTKTFLPNFNGSYSSANAVNNDGTIVAGNTNYGGAVWKFEGNTWSEPQALQKINSHDKNEMHTVKTINNKGDIVGGYAVLRYEIDNIYLNEVPVVWSGKDLTPTILKNDKNKFSNGEVTALSADGKIAVGSINHDSETYGEDDYMYSATIWTGKDWKAFNLGAFTQNGLGYSKANAVNDDGTLIGGEAQFGEGTIDNMTVYAALWHIRYNKDGSVSDSNILTDKTDISTIIVTPINVDFTGKALREMGSSSMALLGQQYHGLKRVQKSCYSKEQGFCYRTYGDWSNADGAKDLNAGVSVGYQFGNGILLGATFDHSLNRSLPTNYKHSDSNFGLGVFARFDHGNWYVSPSLAWNYYDAKVKRNPYAFTESEEQKAKVKGFGLGLTFGQDFTLANQTAWGWYGRLSTAKITRSAFAEKNLALPFSYGEMKLEETAIALGAKLELPISEQFRALLNAEVEQQLSGNTPSFSASGKITNFTEKYRINRTRAKIQAGVAYKFNPSFELSVMPYVEKGIYGTKRYGAEVNLSGRF